MPNKLPALKNPGFLCYPSDYLSYFLDGRPEYVGTMCRESALTGLPRGKKIIRPCWCRHDSLYKYDYSSRTGRTVSADLAPQRLFDLFTTLPASLLFRQAVSSAPFKVPAQNRYADQRNVQGYFFETPLHFTRLSILHLLYSLGRTATEVFSRGLADGFLDVASDEEVKQACAGDFELGAAIFSELLPNLSVVCRALSSDRSKVFAFVLANGFGTLKVRMKYWDGNQSYVLYQAVMNKFDAFDWKLGQPLILPKTEG